jgi:hypothetical protein
MPPLKSQQLSGHRHETGLLNLSRGGQGALGFLKNYMQRIEFGPIPKFYPFVVTDNPDEPKYISAEVYAFGLDLFVTHGN